MACQEQLHLILKELKHLASGNDNDQIDDEQLEMAGRTKSDVMSRGGSATGMNMMMMLDIPEDNLDFFDKELRLNDFEESYEMSDSRNASDESGHVETLEQSRLETETGYDEIGK